MRVACLILIKASPERVPGKNSRVLNGKRLYEYIIKRAKDDIYLDTDSDEIKAYCAQNSCLVIDCREGLAQNTANGNDMLNYYFDMHPEYGYYVLLFAMAFYLQPESIKVFVGTLVNSTVYDSCFTAVKHQGLFWQHDTSINYRPCILPSGQDMVPMVEETTDLYGMSHAALDKYRCRIGPSPISTM